MTATSSVTRRCLGPGLWEVTDGAYVVTVSREPGLRPVWAGQWIARADWDRHLASDPVTTKRRAVEIAEAMLTDAQEVSR